MTSCRCCAPRSRRPRWMSTPAGNLMTWPSRVAWRPRLRRALREQNADVLEASEPVAVVAAVAADTTAATRQASEPVAVVAAVAAAAAAAGAPVVIGTVGAGDLWKTVTEPLVA